MQWFITGCSSGLGLELARSVLAAGHRVIASSRNPSQNSEAVAEIEGLGGVWIQMDVAAVDVEQLIAAAIAKHGPIDVLVNNAGYASGGVLETYSLEQGRRQMETNFFGPIRTIQAVLPLMRERRSGVIVNVSSAEFWHPLPVTGAYSASKFALEGVSETLQGEVVPFGIRVLIVEPGNMRTKFIDPSSRDMPEIPAAYKGTMADHVLAALVSTHGKQDLDPRKAAEAIVKEVSEPSAQPPLLRMPLGKESLEDMKARAADFARTAQRFEKVALGADFKE